MKNNKIDASSIISNNNDCRYTIYIPDEDEDKNSQNENHNSFVEKEQTVSNNKSIEFVKQRIANGQTNGMENNKYEHEFISTNFEEVIRSIIYSDTTSINYNFESHSWQYKLKCSIGNTSGEFNVTIKYNPDVQFEYFTMKRCTCDGTLMFYYDLNCQIIDTIMSLGTYNSTTLPSDFNENPFKYDVVYTVGDFVLGSEYGKEFSTEEKPWILSRFTVMLPIKCEWIKKEEKRC